MEFIFAQKIHPTLLIKDLNDELNKLEGYTSVSEFLLVCDVPLKGSQKVFLSIHYNKKGTAYVGGVVRIYKNRKRVLTLRL